MSRGPLTGRRLGEHELEQRARREACPACGAGPGQPCTTPRGDYAATHQARKRLARYVPLERGRGDAS